MPLRPGNVRRQAGASPARPRPGVRSARRGVLLSLLLSGGPLSRATQRQGRLRKESFLMTTLDEKPATPLADPAAKGPAAEAPSGYREIRYEHSRNFPAVLERLGVSLLVSTYQAGKLFVVGSRQGRL